MSRMSCTIALLMMLALVALASACLERGQHTELVGIEGRANIGEFGPQWSQSDEWIVFAFRGNIYSIGIHDGELKKIFDPGGRLPARSAQVPQISRGGERVAFSLFEPETCFLGVMCAEDPSWSIVVADLDGSGKTVVTRNKTGGIGSATWSPDGKRLAFMSNQLSFKSREDDFGPFDFSLFTVNPDGTDEVNVTPTIGDATAHAPAWSPDGRFIAFSVHGDPDKQAASVSNPRTIDGDPSERFLRVANLQDSSLTELGKIDAGPVWSPDGRRLAFASHEGDVTSLYTVEPNGSNLTTVHQRVSKSESVQSVPSIGGLHWSPDGTKIMMSGNIVLSVVDADGSDFSVLLYEDHAQYVGAYPSWSRDGSMIAFHDPDAWDQVHNVVVVMQADGSEKRSLVKFLDDGNHKWHLESTDEELREIQGTPRALRFAEPTPTPSPSAKPSTPNTQTHSEVSEASHGAAESDAKQITQHICINGQCSPRDVSGANLFTVDVAGTTEIGADLPTVEDLLEKGLHLAGASPVHIVAEGSGQNSSLRCDWRGSARTASQREASLRFWLGKDDDEALPSASQAETEFMSYINQTAARNRPFVKAMFLPIARGGVSEEILTLTCYADYTTSQYALGGALQS